jgi:hypothetical protein
MAEYGILIILSSKCKTTIIVRTNFVKTMKNTMTTAGSAKSVENVEQLLQHRADL